MLTRRLSALMLVLGALLVPISSGSASATAAPPEPAAAHQVAARANPDNCRGHVKDFYKQSGTVYMHYRIICDAPQDRIFVTAFLREPTREPNDVHTYYRQCRDTKFCVAIASLPDRAGTQRYYGRAASSFDTMTESGVTNNGRSLICDENLTCGGGYKDL